MIRRLYFVREAYSPWLGATLRYWQGRCVVYTIGARRPHMAPCATAKDLPKDTSLDRCAPREK